MRSLSILLIAPAVAILMSCGSPGTEFGRSLIVKTDVWPGGTLGQDTEDIYGDEIIIMFLVPINEPYPLEADKALKDIAEGERDHCWSEEAEWRLGQVPIMVCPTPGYTRNDFVGVVYRLE